MFFNNENRITGGSVHVQCVEKGRYSAKIEKDLYNSIFASFRPMNLNKAR
jgi:hypothetical protein